MDTWIPIGQAEPLPGDQIRFILKSGFSDTGHVLGVGMNHYVHSEYGDFPLYTLAFWQFLEPQIQA
jgi:hypothetical protein